MGSAIAELNKFKNFVVINTEIQLTKIVRFDFYVAKKKKTYFTVRFRRRDLISDLAGYDMNHLV